MGSSEQEALLIMAETNANNGIYLKRLVDEHGIELREFNDEIFDSFGEATAQVFDETRQHSELTERIYKSFVAAR